MKNLRLFLIYCSILFLFGCKHRKPLPFEDKSGVTTSNSIGRQKIDVRTKGADTTGLARKTGIFTRTGFEENRFFSPGDVEFVKLNASTWCVPTVYSDHFVLLVTGYQNRKSASGSLIHSYKAVYLYNLNTAQSLLVSHRLLEGITTNFCIFKDYVMICEVEDPFYDVVGKTHAERASAVKYIWTVLKLEDFSITDDRTAHRVLKKANEAKEEPVLMKEELKRSLQAGKLTYDYSAVKACRFSLKLPEISLAEIAASRFNTPAFTSALRNGEPGFRNTKDTVSFVGNIRLHESEFSLVRIAQENGIRLFLYDAKSNNAYPIFTEAYEEPRLKAYIFDDRVLLIAHDYIDYVVTNHDITPYEVKVLEPDPEGKLRVVPQPEAEEVLHQFLKN